MIDSDIHNLCPVDLHPLVPVPVCDEGEVRAKVTAARAAQPGWDRLGLDVRTRLLKQAARRMLERRQEVLELLHDEAGKTPAEILMSEAAGPLQYVSDWARVIKAHWGPKRVPISRLAFPGKSATVRIVPRGVVGIISPWNYPMANFFKPVFPALLCGNTVVLKPSEYAPHSAAWFAGVISEFVPAGVISCVQGDRVAGQRLVRAGIDAVTFTGSFYSGREVAKLAAEQMIPCSVELGGKDAAIVLADCAIDRTVAGIMHWALHNAGQACGAIDRVYVEDAIADRFVESLGRAVARLRTGSGDPQTSDVGPLVNDMQLRTVTDLVEDAVARGARLVCGGKRMEKGRWYEPTVLDRCDHTMRVCKEPTFGPVLPIVRVRDAEEALALANDSSYGLGGSVWSQDRRRASALAARLEVGTSFVNNHAFTGAIPAAPWTGVKQSGHGVANSAFALGHYTRPRTQVIDRGRSCDAWWFPVNGTLEDLGHRLSYAQLGKLIPAIRIPFIISRRKRQVLDFVRTGAVESLEIRKTPPKSLKKWTSWLPRPRRPALTRRELQWGEILFETIFPPAHAPLLPALQPGQASALLRDMLDSIPLTASLGMRAGIWAAGFVAPIALKRRWVTLEQLSPEERRQVVEMLNRSDHFLVRQVAMLLKATAAFTHASTSRFQEVKTRTQARAQVGAPHAAALAAAPPRAEL